MTMRDSVTITFRAPAALQDGLRRAAADDHRTLSSLLVKVLSDWLEAQGYTAPPKQQAKAKPRAARKR
jgi:hypothetical protein